jgi:hypothetical protein
MSSAFTVGAVGRPTNLARPMRTFSFWRKSAATLTGSAKDLPASVDADTTAVLRSW